MKAMRREIGVKGVKLLSHHPHLLFWPLRWQKGCDTWGDTLADEPSSALALDLKTTAGEVMAMEMSKTFIPTMDSRLCRDQWRDDRDGGHLRDESVKMGERLELDGERRMKKQS